MTKWQNHNKSELDELSYIINKCGRFRGKRWDENLVKPQLDYSEIFEEDVGQIPG